MPDNLVKQSIAELQDLVRCRCHPAYTGRGLHDPDCECDSAEAVRVVTDRIEDLEAKLKVSEEIGRAFEEALTPSGDTKAEYAGEFHISVYDAEDEDGNEIWRNVPVDWTTIKAIMAAIKARATLAELKGEKHE